MKSWLAHNRSALIDAVRRLTRTPFSSLFTTVAIGVALSLPAGLYLAFLNLDYLAGHIPARPELSLFIADSASQTDTDKLKKRIEAHAGLQQHRFVSRDSALKLLEDQGLADVTAGLGRNPLPDAWILTPKDASPAALEGLSKEFSSLPGVERLQHDSAWAQRLHVFLRIGERVILVLALLFAVALIAISSNAIRAQILSRRDEIEVSRLIGATDQYIRRPFLYFGGLQGALGGLTALAIVLLLQTLLAGPVAELATLYGSPYRLRGLGPLDGGLLLGGTMLFSWLGAWVAVSRTLRQID